MNNIKKQLESYPDISFIGEKKLEEVQQEMIADFTEKYEELTGRPIKLALADPNRLILYAASLQLYQLYSYVDYAGKQGFLKYASGDNLDNLGALKRLSRNPGDYASTMLRFCVEEPQQLVITIPMGTRATAGDGIFFYTTKTVEITAGATQAEVTATCDTIGAVGNGYKEGIINTLVNPIAYIKSVRNISISQGGTETETDEKLAERIYLSPSAYSVAGPKDAYKYWIKSYNTAIEDVFVDSPRACEIDIRFTLEGGELPEESMIDGLLEYLSDDAKRPQTDLIKVAAPDIATYDIKFIYYITRSDMAVAETIQKEVQRAAKVYTQWQSEKIGRDINPSVLVAKIIQAGAKRVEVTSPTFTELPATCIARLDKCEIVYGGLEDD